ncbi:ATP-binding cassette domain-containing protein [Vogesella fluminis]|uniref:ABC transporter ATP-binding protein n=1 Tax=Vogesella fluminis TaxID=1069161 RepID=A0ABQ3H9I6_9NEIS|nr:ATP-binding cassette domain-containing protein [Vogesella fluminis]GHD75467.1 ABC transporter ATP-binding protein [Vogesella fluminis]
MLFDIDIRKTLQAGSRSFALNLQLQSSSQRIVIYGPSGAGKSLTLKAVAGLLRPEHGHIRLNGRTLFDQRAGVNLAPQARQVGYLFQDYALFPHLDVRQNIAFGLSRGWLNPRTGVRHDAVEYWLRAFGLETMAHQLPDELSGGQRQRVALARAIVARPRALLLDEPFAALDLSLRHTMRRELSDLQQHLQIPIVLITHDPQDVEIFGDHVFQLRDGRLDAQETAACHLPASEALACGNTTICR